MWRLRYAESPFGEIRGDMRIANLCALVANMMRAKDTPAIPLKDFLLFKDQVDDEDEGAEQGDIVSPETREWLYAVAKVKH